MQGPKVRSTARLDGKTVVITGANTGIGKVTAMDLSKRGARVVMLCRDMEKAEGAAEEIRKATEGEVVVHKLDLASLASVRECAEQLGNSLEKIDILINNAGIMACPEMRTKEGFEMQIGTNHFGHFLLTNLLLPLLKKAAPTARIVNVSSMAHTRGHMLWDDINWEKTPYNAIQAYGQSKLANILFTKELARKGEGSGVNAYSLHPGVINTELGRHLKDTFGPMVCVWKLAMPFIKTAESGANTTIYCAVDESIADHNGRYYSDCAEKQPAPQAEIIEDAKKLWEVSEQLVGLNQV
jgi:NAD(P)-dependent dehydrogenase (short-subunit alcohol dehydrogenase family)